MASGTSAKCMGSVPSGMFFTVHTPLKLASDLCGAHDPQPWQLAMTKRAWEVEGLSHRRSRGCAGGGFNARGLESGQRRHSQPA